MFDFPQARLKQLILAVVFSLLIIQPIYAVTATNILLRSSLK